MNWRAIAVMAAVGLGVLIYGRKPSAATGTDTAAGSGSGGGAIASLLSTLSAPATSNVPAVADASPAAPAEPVSSPAVATAAATPAPPTSTFAVGGGRVPDYFLPEGA